MRARGSGSRVGELEIYRRAGRAHSVCRCTSPSYEGEAASAPRSNNPCAHNRKRPSLRRSAVPLAESGNTGVMKCWVRSVSHSRSVMPTQVMRGRRTRPSDPPRPQRHLNAFELGPISSRHLAFFKCADDGTDGRLSSPLARGHLDGHDRMSACIQGTHSAPYHATHARTRQPCR